MKKLTRYLVPALLLSALLWAACSNLRPLQKGESVTCPSCGASFTIEEGMKHSKL